jgi:hypothetical protein
LGARVRFIVPLGRHPRPFRHMARRGHFAWSGRTSPCSEPGPRRPLRKPLSDVPGAEPAALAPVGVPVGPVGASGAPTASAADVFLPIGDASTLRPLLLRLEAVPGDQQSPGEDQQAAEIVLIEGSYPAEQVSVKGHLGYERTQGAPGTLKRPSGPRATGCGRRPAASRTGASRRRRGPRIGRRGSGRGREADPRSTPDAPGTEAPRWPPPAPSTRAWRTTARGHSKSHSCDSQS